MDLSWLKYNTAFQTHTSGTDISWKATFAHPQVQMTDILLEDVEHGMEPNRQKMLLPLQLKQKPLYKDNFRINIMWYKHIAFDWQDIKNQKFYDFIIMSKICCRPEIVFLHLLLSLYLPVTEGEGEIIFNQLIGRVCCF